MVVEDLQQRCNYPTLRTHVEVVASPVTGSDITTLAFGGYSEHSLEIMSAFLNWKLRRNTAVESAAGNSVHCKPPLNRLCISFLQSRLLLSSRYIILIPYKQGVSLRQPFCLAHKGVCWWLVDGVLESIKYHRKDCQPTRLSNLKFTSKKIETNGSVSLVAPTRRAIVDEDWLLVETQIAMF